MTVTDFMKTLIIDPSNKISIQSNRDGKMTELYNSEKLFNTVNNIEFEAEIQYIKIENKSIFIVV